MAAGKTTCLHGHKGAPDLRRGAVEQASDNVAEQQDNVGPVARDLDGQLLAPSGNKGSRRGLAAEERLLLVCDSIAVAGDGRGLRGAVVGGAAHRNRSSGSL